ncbi:hypothetical protein M413DRAFT_447528 [Hebeloma cylindrosporum]|uniref:Uncharacterized protein n=1 Tax=Hebeloma cylindrosporum TaxID=76867 RepID=A0A0C2XM64_HEBCY|nr:hypothetical protein M413DRAFT_447528 [Hebeloma cylindrosporum h7]
MESTDKEIEPRNGDMGVVPPTTRLDTTLLFPGPRQAEWDIMYYALGLQGRGSPIHTPDPPNAQPVEYRKQGFSIGDVILLSSRGRVDFHFNTCVPAGSPFNGRPKHIPQGFSPLHPPLDPANIHDYAPFQGHTVLNGRSVRKYQIQGRVPGVLFDAVAEEMAILTIPEGVKSRDVIDVSCFRKYIASNAIAWYKFINEVHDRYATNGDLRLVVGLDRCSAWSRVVTSSVTVEIPHDDAASTKSLSQFGVCVNSGGTGVLQSSVNGRPVMDRDGVVYQNQSVFLRTLNISVCDEIWTKIAEEFRPHVETYRNEMHPANGINELLLKQKPHAKFAITQDNDWISVLKPDDPCLPAASEFLSRILEVYNVCEEDDVVFLEYRPEVLYRTYLKHNHDTSLTLALWSPTIVAVGAVGYLSRDDGKFKTLFNARAPRDSTARGVHSLPALRTKIVPKMHREKGLKDRAFDLFGLLNLGRKSDPPQRVTFPLKVGENAAHLYTGNTSHRRFECDHLPMEWCRSNIEKIIEIYGADHNITRGDVVLVTGTLDTQDYALFVSACHREGSAAFEVGINPRIGQPWGAFLSENNGQFHSKVSRYRGPWETVLVSCFRVASNAIVLSG